MLAFLAASGDEKGAVHSAPLMGGQQMFSLDFMKMSGRYPTWLVFFHIIAYCLDILSFPFFFKLSYLAF